MAGSGEGSENVLQNGKKNTAEGGYGRTLRVVCALFVYECTSYIVDGGHLDRRDTYI
jgi:hypothetical protein